MEMHQLGPVKLFDTPGTDEEGVLGEKKRRKAFDALKVGNPSLPGSFLVASHHQRSFLPRSGVQRRGRGGQPTQPSLAQRCSRHCRPHCVAKEGPREGVVRSRHLR